MTLTPGSLGACRGPRQLRPPPAWPQAALAKCQPHGAACRGGTGRRVRVRGPRGVATPAAEPHTESSREEAPGTTAAQPEARGAGLGGVTPKMPDSAAAKAPTAPPGPSPCPGLPAACAGRDAPALPETSSSEIPPLWAPLSPAGGPWRGAHPPQSQGCQSQTHAAASLPAGKAARREPEPQHQPGCSKHHPDVGKHPLKHGQASPQT